MKHSNLQKILFLVIVAYSAHTLVAMAPVKDYYYMLGVKKDADQNTITKAYRKLALKWHPDKNKTPEAQQQFSEINEAYTVLKDPVKRAEYDQVTVVPGKDTPKSASPSRGAPENADSFHYQTKQSEQSQYTSAKKNPSPRQENYGFVPLSEEFYSDEYDSDLSASDLDSSEIDGFSMTPESSSLEQEFPAYESGEDNFDDDSY